MGRDIVDILTALLLFAVLIVNLGLGLKEKNAYNISLATFFLVAFIYHIEGMNNRHE